MCEGSHRCSRNSNHRRDRSLELRELASGTARAIRKHGDHRSQNDPRGHAGASGPLFSRRLRRDRSGRDRGVGSGRTTESAPRRACPPARASPGDSRRFGARLRPGGASGVGARLGGASRAGGLDRRDPDHGLLRVVGPGGDQSGHETGPGAASRDRVRTGLGNSGGAGLSGRSIRLLGGVGDGSRDRPEDAGTDSKGGVSMK